MEGYTRDRGGERMHKETYKEYQPIVEPLNLVWRYDPKIFGKKWEDWIPHILPAIFFDCHKLN